MIDLLNIFICPGCGEILADQIETITEIDCDNDDVYAFAVCSKCCNEVSLKLNENGFPCYKEVDHERWLWAVGFYDEEDEEDE